MDFFLELPRNDVTSTETIIILEKKNNGLTARHNAKITTYDFVNAINHLRKLLKMLFEHSGEEIC